MCGPNTTEKKWLVPWLLLVVLLLGSAACQSPPGAPEAERIFWDSRPTWVPPLPALQVAPDETSAIFGGGRWLQLVDLRTGQADDARKRGRLGLEEVSELAYRAGGRIARRGASLGSAETGWFLEAEEADDDVRSSLPASASVRWSPIDDTVAFWDTGDPRTVMIGAPGKLRSVRMPHDVRALAWSSDGRAVFVLLSDDEGSSSLVRIDAGMGAQQPVAAYLDAPLRAPAIAVSPDGDTVYLPLASGSALDLAARHDPDADRDTAAGSPRPASSSDANSGASLDEKGV